MTVDQPLFALAKEIQLAKPEFLGEVKFRVMIDGLYDVHKMLRCDIIC